MSHSRPASGRSRFRPDPRVLALVQRYGAPRVGLMFGLDADVIRRYGDGASQRTTQWWIESHLETVERDLAGEERGRAKLVVLRSPSGGAGERA